MGREARCVCRSGGASAAVTALLESHELILRGGVRRTFALTSLRRVRVEGPALCFDAGAQTFSLELGADVAARWAAKIAQPPRTLAQKLGIGPSARALVVGTVDDEALRSALAGAEVPTAADARVVVAVVGDFSALRAALLVHDRMPPATAIWVVHGTGVASVRCGRTDAAPGVHSVIPWREPYADGSTAHAHKHRRFERPDGKKGFHSESDRQ